MTAERLTIVCLSSQPWSDGMWTNKQHVMSRLAREHRVIFVNFGPRPLPALLRLKAEKQQNHFGVEELLAPVVEEHHGVTVLDLWGPRLLVRALGPNHPWSIYCTFDVRRALLDRYLARHAIEDAVLWVYHPGYGPAVSEIPRRLLVYDCVDEYSEFPEYQGGASWLVEREAALCRAADVVFTTSQGLYEKKRPLNPERTHLVHNVGDFAHFSRARAADTPVPEELRSLPKPVIGFLGAVSGYKLDIDWLLALARRHREASLVLVGPVGVGDQSTDVGVLAAEPNVHLLGHRPYESLPGYVKGFDVAVIPYRQNEYTANVFPIKFFELLASGKPVVISALPALSDYYETVEVARNAEEFVTACERALLDPARNEAARLSLAAENTWEHRVERLMTHVERALEKGDRAARGIRTVSLGPESEPSSSPAPVPEAKPKVDPARQAGVLVLGTTLATLSSALAPLLVVRLIGKADVGRLLSVTLVYETVAMLLSTGFPYTLLYQTSNRDRPERAAIARRIARIACGMGAAGAAVVVLVALVLRAHPFGYQPSATFEAQLGMLLVLAPSLIADLPFRLMPNLLVAEGLARRSAGLQVLRTIALTLATLVPLALQASVPTVVVCYAAVRWVFGGWVLLELRRLYHSVARVPVPLSTSEFWRFAIPIGMTEAIGILNQQLDRWLVLLALPAARFAEYQVGAWQVPVIGTIAYSVGAAYTPELVKHFQARDPYGALAVWQKSIHKVSLIVLPVTMALAVGAEELVTLLFTKDYAEAAVVFRFYSVLTFLRVASYGNVIVAAGRPGVVVRAAGLGLLYNALFGVPLVLSLGFVGPAVAAACAFVLHVATYVYFIARAAEVPVTKVFPVAGYLRVLSLATVGGAAGYGVKRLLSGHVLVSFLAELFTVLAVFTVLGLLTRTIARADLAYARDWLKLKIVR